MMVMFRDKRDGPITFKCDECKIKHPTGISDFHEAYEDAKENGFLAAKKGTEWVHYCMDCRNNFMNDSVPIGDPDGD